jgi:DNA polymerase III sliding clamp (beta) subunit (PCNA family)
MNFSILSEIIKEGFLKVAKGLVEKSEYGKVIRLSATKDSIALVTTNGETDYRWTYTKRDELDFNVESEGSVTLVAEKLLGALDYLHDRVTFCLENNLLKVAAHKVQLEIKTADIDIEILTPLKPQIRFEFNTSREIPKILHCMSDDPAKPKMTGLLVELQADADKKLVIFKAVQPNRAAKIELSYESDDAVNSKIVFPCFLAKMMSHERMLGFSIDKNMLVACFDNYEIRTPMSDIPFMNPDSAFANTASKSVEFSKSELLKALKLIKSTDKQNSIAKLAVSNDSTEITAYNEQTGRSKVTVKSGASEDFNLSLNFKFIMELISSFDTEDSIEFKTEGKIFFYKNENLHFVTTVFGA